MYEMRVTPIMVSVALLIGCAGSGRVATGGEADRVALESGELRVTAPQSWLVTNEPFHTSWTGRVLWQAASVARTRLQRHGALEPDFGTPRPAGGFDPNALPPPLPRRPADWDAAHATFDSAIERADSPFERYAATYDRDRAAYVALMTERMKPGDAVVFVAFEEERSDALMRHRNAPGRLEAERAEALRYARDEHLEHTRYSFEFSSAARIYRAEAIVCEPASNEVHRKARATLRSMRVVNN